MTAPATPKMTRRRVLFIGAVFAGTIAAGASRGAARADTTQVQHWSGQALGAHATIALVGAQDDVAGQAFGAVLAEIRRLEAIFSLYDAESALSRLNRHGRLADPPADLLALLGAARAAHEATGGLFDPTVQPLFDLYARHFADANADPRGPSQTALDAALKRVGFEWVSVEEDEVGFRRTGMALTLNGIAQGYITDRVAELLGARGFGNMLLDIGEIRAFGPGRDGKGWIVGIEGRDEQLRLTDRAVATSRLLGTVLDPNGRIGHIFDPRRGFVATRRAQVTVVAPHAALADALSTAAVLMDEPQLRALAQSGVQVIT